MITKYGIPIAAVLLIGFAAAYVVNSGKHPPPVSPPVAPPSTPYNSTVAGAGIIESQTEDISIGSPLSGIVAKVLVVEGDKVNQGDPLFQLDDRALQADSMVQQAALASAKAELDKLKHEPRLEDIPVQQALVDEAEATWQLKQTQLARMKNLVDRDAATEEEFEQSQRDFQVAKASLNRAKSQLVLLKAGSWQYEIGIAQAAVARASADVARIATDLDRLIIRAPVNGEVLQVNVRPGEFITTFGQQSALVLGNTRDLHVRVDIDEYDLPRFQKGAPAIARRRGHADDNFPLTFVRIDPFVIPKQSLTGERSERVDTRVLQVIYGIDPQGKQLYVGQQLDVFIEVDGKNTAN